MIQNKEMKQESSRRRKSRRRKSRRRKSSRKRTKVSNRRRKKSRRRRRKINVTKRVQRGGNGQGHMVEMGFDETDAFLALLDANGDMMKAVNALGGVRVKETVDGYAEGDVGYIIKMDTKNPPFVRLRLKDGCCRCSIAHRSQYAFRRHHYLWL